MTLENIGGSADALVEAKPFEIASFERLVPPVELDGRAGTRRIRDGCKIGVETDLDAIRYWLERTSESDATQRSRRSAVEKLLNWAYLHRKKAFSSFNRADFGAFVDFAANPSPPGIWIAARGVSRTSSDWRPFTSPADSRSRLLIGANISSLLKFLREQNYADLMYVHNQWSVREGYADSRLAQPVDCNTRLTEPVPPVEWQWVCRWLDSVESDPVAVLNRLVVELLYFTELKLVEVAALSSSQLHAPASEHDAWVLTLLAKDGRVREFRYIPEPLARTLLMWLGNGPTWTAFQRGERLLDISVDCIRYTLKRVFEGAADLADSCNEVDIAEGLRKRTAMSLRHAYRSHRKDTLDERSFAAACKAIAIAG